MRIGKMKKLLFIFSLFIYSTACGQNVNGVPPTLRYRLSAKHFTTRHGLAANTVWGMFQDQQEFLWMSTADGLNRYDGNTFKLYEKRVSKYDYCSFQTSDGTLWLCTVDQGLSSLSLRTGWFKSYKHKKNDIHTISDNQVTNIYEVQPGNLWVSTLHGLNSLIIKNEQVVSIKHHFFGSDTIQNSKNHYFRKLRKDSQGNIWGLFDNALYKFPVSQLNPEYFEKYKIANPLFHKPICIYEDAQKRFWVGFDSGLGILDQKTGQVTFKGLKNNHIFTIYQDSRHIVWIGTNKGLYWLDEQTGNFIRFKSYMKVLENLGATPIGCIFEDQSGALWIGSIGYGLYQLEAKSHKFSFFEVSANNKEEQNKKLSFWHIQVTDKHLLWLKADNKKGVFSFNYLTGETNSYQHQPDDNQSISDDWVTAIHKDKSGQIWVGTKDGLNLVNEGTGKFKRYYPVSGEKNVVRDILEDAGGNLVVHIANKGLYKYNKNADIFEAYFPLQHNKNRTMLIDQNNILWMDESRDRVTYLCLIDLKSGEKTSFGTVQGFKDYSVLHIFQAKSGQIWLASYRGGLVKATRQSGDSLSLKYYGKKEGLNNQYVYGILEDIQGNLWLSHNKGLSKFNPATEVFENYTISDGIQDAEFMERAFTQTKDGKMFFGGAGGINAFYPEEITPDKYIPPLVFTDFRILNKSVIPGTPGCPFEGTINFTKKNNPDL